MPSILACLIIINSVSYVVACTSRLVCDEGTTINANVLPPTQCRRMCIPDSITGPVSPLHLDITHLSTYSVPRILFKYAVAFMPTLKAFSKTYISVTPNTTFLYVAEQSPPSGIEEYSNPDYADILLSSSDSFVSPSNITDKLLISSFVLRDSFLQSDPDRGTLSVWRDVSDLWREMNLDSFNPLFTQGCSVPGRKVCIPVAISAESFVMYKKRIFNKYNLTFPETWEELLTVCEVFKQNSMLCLSTANYKYATNTNEGPWRIVDIILRRVLSVEKHTQLRNGIVSWEDPEVMFGLQRFMELVDKGYIGFHETIPYVKQFGEQATLLQDVIWNFGVTNENAMVVSSSQSELPIRLLSPDNIDYGSFPHILPIAKRPQRSEVVSLFAINSRNSRAEAFPGASSESVNILKEMLKPAHQSKMSAGFLPVNLSHAQGTPMSNFVRTLGNFTIQPWLALPFTPFMSAFQLSTIAMLERNITAQQAASAIDEARMIYLLKTTPQPVISPLGGTYEKGTGVTLTAAPGATVFYTLDGSTPSDGSNVYSGPIYLNTVGDVTIKARAAQGTLRLSTTVSQSYKVTSSAAVLMGALVGVFCSMLAIAAIATVIFFATNGWRTRRKALRRAPKGAVTIMFADVEGSTELWSTLGPVMHTSIAQMFSIMRKHLNDLRGYEVKTQGDAMMAAFTNWKDALDWCIAVQHSLMTVDWDERVLEHPKSTIVICEGKPIFRGLRVRMGIHEGSNLEQEYDHVSRRVDYFGTDVNYAARIGSVGCGGQIVTSDSIAPFLDESTLIAEYPLKGIPGLHAVYEVPIPTLSERTFVNPPPTTANDATHVPTSALTLASEARCAVCFRLCRACQKVDHRKGPHDPFPSFRRSSEASSVAAQPSLVADLSETVGRT